MATQPAPKPTLLTSLGLQPSAANEPASSTSPPGGESTMSTPSTAPAAEAIAIAAPASEPARRRRPTAAKAAESTPVSPPQAPNVTELLDRLRAANRIRRGSPRPLAPLNVDVPLDLLTHVREVAQDIPYPLRRLAEEALQLWLVAAGRPFEDPASRGET